MNSWVVAPARSTAASRTPRTTSWRRHHAASQSRWASSNGCGRRPGRGHSTSSRRPTEPVAQLLLLAAEVVGQAVRAAGDQVVPWQAGDPEVVQVEGSGRRLRERVALAGRHHHVEAPVVRGGVAEGLRAPVELGQVRRTDREAGCRRARTGALPWPAAGRSQPAAPGRRRPRRHRASCSWPSRVSIGTATTFSPSRSKRRERVSTTLRIVGRAGRPRTGLEPQGPDGGWRR